ncbi:MAG TPA: hypothetical protein VN408_13590 [Actinoplanes sp.]|nr:hypothetical protein [Actinoplanes sp.]
MRTFLQAAAVAAALLTSLAAAPAQANPPGQYTTALLGTYGFGRAAVIGKAGRDAGMWRSYSVRSGFAGDDLTITYRKRYVPSPTETTVYTAAFNEVKDASAECEKVGKDGRSRNVWVTYRCRTGFAPSYTLLVK